MTDPAQRFRYDQLTPAARTLLENHDELDLAEMLAQANVDLARWAEAESADAAAGSYALRAERVEAVLAAVTSLHERWVAAGPPPLGVPMARWWDKRLVELGTVLEQSAHATPVVDGMRAQLAALIRHVPVPAADTMPARHIRVLARHPDEPTVNRFTLSLVDHIRAEFGNTIRMDIATDAHEEPADETATEATGGSCSPGAPETEPNNPKESP